MPSDCRRSIFLFLFLSQGNSTTSTIDVANGCQVVVFYLAINRT